MKIDFHVKISSRGVTIYPVSAFCEDWLTRFAQKPREYRGYHVRREMLDRLEEEGFQGVTVSN